MKQFMLSACILAGLATVTHAGEKVDNPTYQSWAKYKPGSYIVMKTVSEAAGNKTEMLMKQTLKEVTPDKVVVESQTTVSMMGRKMEQPKSEMVHLAKIDKSELPANYAKEHKDMNITVKEGEETIEILGKKIKAKWYETNMNNASMPTTSKVWMSDDVPGMMIKVVSDTGGAMKSHTTQELVEMKLEKR